MRVTPHWLLLFALSVGSAQWYGAGNSFHYDDFHSVVHNPHIRSISNVPHFFVDPSLFSQDAQQAMFRPVTLASYALNYAMAGLDARWFRLFNITLHAINAVLVVLLIRRLFASALIAWAAGLFFGFHPLVVETVQYISSRSESLMVLGLLSSLLAYVRWREGGHWRWYAFSLGAFGFSVLSKSVGCIGLALLLLVDWALYRVPWRQLKYQLPYWGIVAAYIVLSSQVVGKAVGDPVRPWDVQLWTQLKAGMYYMGLMLMPVQLSVEHQFSVALTPARWAVPAAGFCLLSIALWAIYWRQRVWMTALAWSFLSLLPASVIPLIVLVNEHRLYLALVGTSLAWGWLIYRVYLTAPRVALCAVPVYTMVLFSLTVERVSIWRDELSLWTDAAGRAPFMLKPHLRQADALVEVGDWAGAEAAYRHALVLRPFHPATRNNLGRLYMQLGRFKEAETQFRELLEVSPDIVQARLNWASIMLRDGRWQGAERLYREALTYGDTRGEVEKKLGFIALQFRGDAEEAVRLYRAGIARQPEAISWTALGVALRRLPSDKEAEIAYAQALQLEPNHADAWFNLGNLYRDTERLEMARQAYARVVELADEALAQRARNELHLLTPQ